MIENKEKEVKTEKNEQSMEKNETVEQMEKELGVEFAQWQMDLIEDMENMDDEDAKELSFSLFRRMAKEMNAGHPNKEDLEAIQEEIKNIPATEKEVVAGLERKARLLSNRVTRAIPQQVGLLIKHFRTKRGYSLKELEKRTGISAPYIHRIEKGERKAPSYKIIEQLAQALQVPVSEILSVNDESGQGKQKDRVLNVEELLLKESYMVDDKPVSKEQREALSELIKKLNGLEWNENTKTTETITLLDYIGRYVQANKENR